MKNRFPFVRTRKRTHGVFGDSAAVECCAESPRFGRDGGPATACRFAMPWRDLMTAFEAVRRYWGNGVPTDADG